MAEPEDRLSSQEPDDDYPMRRRPGAWEGGPGGRGAPPDDDYSFYRRPGPPSTAAGATGSFLWPVAAFAAFGLTCFLVGWVMTVYWFGRAAANSGIGAGGDAFFLQVSAAGGVAAGVAGALLWLIVTRQRTVGMGVVMGLVAGLGAAVFSYVGLALYGAFFASQNGAGGGPGAVLGGEVCACGSLLLTGWAVVPGLAGVGALLGWLEHGVTLASRSANRMGNRD